MKPKHQDLLEEAVAFAVKSHTGLFDDGASPVPYCTHPVEVMRILRYTGGVGDPTMLIAAVLHDTVEQSGVKPSKVRKRFGKEVALLVEELTRREPSAEETKGLKKEKLQRLRFQMLLDDIQKMTPSAKSIKLADRLSNLRAGRDTKASKLAKYLEETSEVLSSIPREVNPALWDEVSRLLESMRDKPQSLP